MEKIISGSFSEACCNGNSLRELKYALSGSPDKIDMEKWGLTAEEWKKQIEMAIEWMEYFNSQKKEK